MPVEATILTTEGLLNLLKETLEPWLAANQGEISLSQDQTHVLELLRVKPGSFQVILGWDGEEAMGQSPHFTHATRQKLQVIVSHNRGMHILAGGATAWREGDAPLVARAAAVRDKIRGLVMPHTADEGRLKYTGMSTVTVEDIPLDAYMLEFSAELLLGDAATEEITVPE